MPPALSDYDSDGSLICNTIEAETSKETLSTEPQSPSRQSSAPAPSGKFTKGSIRAEPRAATVGTSHSSSRFSSSTRSPAFAESKPSRGKERSRMLAGIELGNIISHSDNEEDASARDTPPTSSIPTSSYRTRQQVHGSHKREICYDQQYHPMDDIVHPARAAKMRIKYGEELPASDDMLSCSNIDDECNDTDAETDNEAEAKKKAKNMSSQPTRRSGRQVNSNVIYNTNVHPQDGDIEQIERADWEHLKVSRKRKKVEDVGSDDEVKGDVAQVRKDSAFAMDLTVIADSDMSDSESLYSSADVSEQENTPVEHSPRENVRIAVPLEPKARKVLAEIDPYPYVKGLPFTIYEDPTPHEELMAAAPDPEDFDDHDKENDRSHAEFEETEDPLAGITVEVASNLQHDGQVDEEHGEHDTNEFLYYISQEAYEDDEDGGPDSVLGVVSSEHMGLDGALLPDLDTSSFVYVDRPELEDEDQTGGSEFGTHISDDTEMTQ